MNSEETFGITLAIHDWQALFRLSINADRFPSDYLRTLIRRESERIFDQPPGAPNMAATTPTPPEAQS